MVGYIFTTKGHYYVTILEERNNYFIGYSIKDKKKYIFEKKYFIEEL